MKTIEKIDIKKMKNDIKKLSQEQRELKNQRRTELLVGERTMTPYQAACKHTENREKLRALHAGYGVARGKSFSTIENKYPEEGHPLHSYQWLIDRILKKNTIMVEVEDVEEVESE